MQHRVVGDGPALPCRVQRALLLPVRAVTGPLRANQARQQTTADVVRGADPARPDEREAVVADPARVHDPAVEIVDQSRDGHGLQVLRLRGRHHETGDAAVRVAEDADGAVRPRLVGDPVVDDLLAVERGAPGEEVELAARAAGAAHRRVHGHVVPVEVVRQLAAVVNGNRGTRRDADIFGERPAVGGSAVVPRHLEDRRVARPGDVVRGHADVHRDRHAVAHRDVAGRRRRRHVGPSHAAQRTDERQCRPDAEQTPDRPSPPHPGSPPHFASFVRLVRSGRKYHICPG